MQRIAFFVYGVLAHVLFLAVFAYMVGFMGNILVPKSIDAPAVAGPLWLALVIDTLLVLLFVVPHSIMARPGFKRWWTRIVPAPIERATYVMIANICMIVLLWQWRPVGTIFWDVQPPVARAILWGLFAAGWLMVPVVSLLINHFDLFGTRQVWLHLKGRPYTPVPFKLRGIYKWVRHPLYIGWMTAFWAIPTMTLGHLLFAVLTTAYMIAAIPHEERDLVTFLGDTYDRYRQRVPALIPRRGRSVRSEADVQGEAAAEPAPAHV